jgi:hypothetical protein
MRPIACVVASARSLTHLEVRARVLGSAFALGHLTRRDWLMESTNPDLT